MNTRNALIALLIVAPAYQAAAQSLYLTAGTETLNDPNAPALELEEVSLTFIPEPEVKVFKAHDIVTIIIDEVSSQESSQTLETEKESSTSAQIATVVDLISLLELRLRENERINDLDLIDFDASREFEGEGDYEREDRFSARIAATILEVKPNGTVVLEARKRIVKDDEVQTLVIAGLARHRGAGAHRGHHAPEHGALEPARGPHARGAARGRGARRREKGLPDQVLRHGLRVLIDGV